MKTSITLTVLCLSLLVGACQTTPQPSVREELPARMPENLEERFVHQVVFSLRDSFASHDGPSFMKHVSEGFYQGWNRLATNLEDAFATSGAETVRVEILEIVVDDPRVTALIRWERIPAGEGALAKEGTTELIFQKGDTLNLVNFRKDTLFGISGF